MGPVSMDSIRDRVNGSAFSPVSSPLVDPTRPEGLEWPDSALWERPASAVSADAVVVAVPDGSVESADPVEGGASGEPGVCAGPVDGPVDPVALTGSVGPAALERPTAPSLSGTTGWLRVRPC